MVEAQEFTPGGIPRVEKNKKGQPCLEGIIWRITTSFQNRKQTG